MTADHDYFVYINSKEFVDQVVEQIELDVSDVVVDVASAENCPGWLDEWNFAAGQMALSAGAMAISLASMALF